VAPTNEGARFLEHAKNVLFSLETLERELGSNAHNLRGTIRVLANRSASAELIPMAVCAFLQEPKHRNIDVHIAEASSQEVVAGVKSGQAAIGVCWADADMVGVEWRPSRRERLSAVVPKHHPLAKQEQVTFADTLEYDQVGITAGGPLTSLLRRESIRTKKLLRYRVVAPTFDAMVRFVEANLAIAIMPTEVALRYTATSPLVCVPLGDAWKERQFAAFCRSLRALPRPAVALFNYLTYSSGAP
jgi:DNA-binding transcriptional LysR family regulator